MLNPAALVSALSTAHNVASGVYHAGAGMPKYRLYETLFKAAPSNLSSHQEGFIHFLVRARILLREDDYNTNIKPYLPYIYQAYTVLLSSGALVTKPDGTVSSPTMPSAPKESIKEEQFPICLDIVERRYKEFSDVYEKISAKEYPTHAMTIQKQIQSSEDMAKTKASTSKSAYQVPSVKLSFFRDNLSEFLSVERKGKKVEKEEEEEKEINIEKSAITEGIDTNPIPCTINQQIVYITPRKVQRKNELKGRIDSRAAAATKELEEDEAPITDIEKHKKYLKSINSGIKAYLTKSEAHKEDKFLNKNLATVGKLSMSSALSKPFQPLPPQTAAHVLAIIAILSEGKSADPTIDKTMSISRIVTIGQLNQYYKRAPLSTNLENSDSVEAITKAINDKLSPPESQKLIQTLHSLYNNTHPKKINASMDAYINDALYHPTDSGKQPIESIIEFCEADATAKEYIESTEKTLHGLTAYLTMEADKAPDECQAEAHELKQYLTVISNNATFSPATSVGTPDSTTAHTGRDHSTTPSTETTNEDKYEHDDETSFESTDLKEKGQSPLKKFSNTLQERINKKQDESTQKKLLKKMTMKSDKSSQKKEMIGDKLSDASSMIEENLIFVLEEGNGTYKTKESNDRIEDLQKQINESEKLVSTLRTTLPSIEKRITEENTKNESQTNSIKNKINKINSEVDDILKKMKSFEVDAKKKQEVALKNLEQEIKKGIQTKTSVAVKSEPDTEKQLNDINDELMSKYSELINDREALKNDLNKLSSSENEYNELTQKIEEVEEKISMLTSEVESIEAEYCLESPESIVKSICDSMDAARIRNENGQIKETVHETKTQSELFSEFYTALSNTSSEGKKLAAYMKDYVENTLNKNNACPIHITDKTKEPKLGMQSSGSASQKVETVEDVNSLINDRASLLETARKMHDIKSKENPRFNKDRHENKVLFLKNVIDFLENPGLDSKNKFNTDLMRFKTQATSDKQTSNNSDVFVFYEKVHAHYQAADTLSSTDKNAYISAEGPSQSVPKNDNAIKRK